MKTTFKLSLLTVMVSLFVCSCGFKRGNDVREENDKIIQDIQTEQGCRDYLSGKTYVFDGFIVYFGWYKISFIDKNTAIYYSVSRDNRSWGNGKTYRYEVGDHTDLYGRKDGIEIQLFEEGEKYSSKSFTLMYDNPTVLQCIESNSIAYGQPIELHLVGSPDYLPLEWR